MKMAQKWDPQTAQYSPYELPEMASAYAGKMDEVIQCASCGRKLTYDMCYTSRQIHTEMGFGYGVCENCYEKEWEDE